MAAGSAGTAPGPPKDGIWTCGARSRAPPQTARPRNWGLFDLQLYNICLIIVSCDLEDTMPKEAVLQIRIDSALKEQAEQLYRELGTSFPEAVRVFARQSVMQRGMPFTPRTAYAPIGSSAGVFSAYVRPGLREKESQAFADAMKVKHASPS